MNKENKELTTEFKEEIKETKETELDTPINKEVKKFKTISLILTIVAIGLAIFSFVSMSQSTGTALQKELVEDNDKLLVDMIVTEDGKKNDNRSFSDVLIGVNKDSFSEDIIKTLKGAKLGETKSVTIKETLLKDGVKINDIPASAFQDGSASKYYEEKNVEYTFKIKTIWKYGSTVEKTEDKTSTDDKKEDTKNQEKTDTKSE